MTRRLVVGYPGALPVSADGSVLIDEKLRSGVARYREAWPGGDVVLAAPLGKPGGLDRAGHAQPQRRRPGVRARPGRHVERRAQQGSRRSAPPPTGSPSVRGRAPRAPIRAHHRVHPRGPRHNGPPRHPRTHLPCARHGRHHATQAPVRVMGPQRAGDPVQRLPGVRTLQPAFPVRTSLLRHQAQGRACRPGSCPPPGQDRTRTPLLLRPPHPCERSAARVGCRAVAAARGRRLHAGRHRRRPAGSRPPPERGSCGAFPGRDALRLGVDDLCPGERRPDGAAAHPG